MRLWESYILGVEDGSIVVGKLIRQSVERWRHMERDTTLYFDAERVERCIKFFGIFKHFKGKSAGKSFTLEPWQAYIVATVIGWRRKVDDRRVIRKLYIQMARKNGKTAFVAALLLYLSLADGEFGAEGDLAANSKQQAKICYEFANEFARQLDSRGRRLKRFRDYITDSKTRSKIQVFAADDSKLDGFDASVYVLDEYHAAKNSRLHDVLDSSQGSRAQPLGIIATTAGFDKLAPCYLYREMCVEVLSGVKQDDTLAAFVYELDDDDDWHDPAVWVKANPNMGVTVDEEFIASKVNEVANHPSAEVGVRTKVLNQWCDAEEVWLPDHYIVSATAELPEWVHELPCYAGIDLSTTTDLSALGAMWVDAPNQRYYFRVKYYLPTESLSENRFKVLYGEWHRKGLLNLTPGNVVDYDYILNDLMELNASTRLLSVAYDAYNATQFVINATNRGLPMLPFSQALGNFNKPTKEMERLMMSGMAVVDNNEINRHCFRNVVLARDHNGNIKPSKQFVEKKIDGVIVMLEAIGAYMADPHYSPLI